MNERMNERMNELMNERERERVRVSESMNERTNERMCIHVCMSIRTHVYIYRQYYMTVAATRRMTTSISGLLSNQGEKSINFYFIRVPLGKKVLKYGTPKPRSDQPTQP